MGFLIVYLSIGSICSFFSGYLLTASANYPARVEIGVYALFLAAWFLPIAVWRWQHRNSLSLRFYNRLAYCSYLLFGMAFLMFALLMLRDFAWYTAYLFGLEVPSPFVSENARVANLITLAVLILGTLYAVHSAEKLPQVRRYAYQDGRIKRPLTLLVISDWHINRTISPQKVAQKVAFLNNLQADIMLLPGDIADDSPESMREQLRCLKKLAAPLGIYYCVGNHEIYHNAFAWEAAFAALGWRVLHNSGVAVEGSGVYICGVPDYAGFRVDIGQAVARAADSDYRILLTHTPVVVGQTAENKADLTVAGHTHGGQVFPFNLLTKFGNAGFVAGEYRLENGTILLLSRGVGYWGPPMRLFAPSDVLLIKLNPAAGVNDILENPL